MRRDSWTAPGYWWPLVTSSVTTRRPVCSTSWWRPPADQLPLPALGSVACNVIILPRVCLRFLRQDFKVANKTWKIICDRQEGAQVLLATVRRTYHYQSIPSSGPSSAALLWMHVLQHCRYSCSVNITKVTTIVQCPSPSTSLNRKQVSSRNNILIGLNASLLACLYSNWYQIRTEFINIFRHYVV